MKLFIKYLREYRAVMLLLAVFCGTFAAVLALYDVSPEPILYGFAICMAVTLIVAVCGFFRFRKKHSILKEIYSNLPLMTDDIPPADSPTEEDLQAIIDRLARIERQTVTDMRTARRESSDYFTVWVHQIKTPISAMQMILQSEDTAVNKELSAELFRIEQYAEMALHYIRLDSSASDFVIKHYDLDNIIRQAVHRYAPLFIRKRIQLNYKPFCAEVLTDEKWLVFVVEQLLSNAAKYTAQGSTSIRFENGILSVADTGIGISAEDIPRIFEKGYTGMSGRTDRKSTGLGLYLCKKVCGKLGHGISVSSEVGRGTIFYIDLSEKNIDID